MRVICVLLALAAAGLPPLSAQPASSAAWTVYITNDACSDYTWGFNEEDTRRAFAELVRAHLDEMRRTDGESPENRSRYNMSITQEALCFLERYPGRKQELIARIREGRLYVSPFLNNSLWGFQSIESALRTLYPSRRLEKETGVRFDVAEHIEEPALPWGMASLLSGAGIRWVSVPFYDYDSTFPALTNPPLFALEGPDGSRLRVVLDAWASSKANYTQGARLLREPKLILDEALPQYQRLGSAYPVCVILASGTHGDTSPKSGEQARAFAEAIIRYNSAGGDRPRLFNATLPQFCRAVDEAEARVPFLKVLRGCLGHSWDLWPVSLAGYVATMREGERQFLAAEALLARAMDVRPEVAGQTRTTRERAEWVWSMLADHAWNGTDDANKNVNATLRRNWSEELLRLSAGLREQAWSALGLRKASGLTLFNSLSAPRSGLVCIEEPKDGLRIGAGDVVLASQAVEREGRRELCFLSPEAPGFGLLTLNWTSRPGPARERNQLSASPAGLESPFYRLTADPVTGGIGSIIHKATGRELVSRDRARSLGQTVYFDGREHTLSNVQTGVVAAGPVFATLRIIGVAAGLTVTSFVTVFADLDRIDFDIRVHKPVTSVEQRLCHLFPVHSKGTVLRLETPGAIIRPAPQPGGDLLPGADTHRFAVQGFVDVSMPDGPGVTIAPVDAFALRLDLDPLTFEALGNDQNYKEVVRDQHGVTDFRFRYSLRAHAGPYNQAEAIVWSRSVTTPLLVMQGSLPATVKTEPPVSVDPRRALATCFKPADDPADGGRILRVWELAGECTPLAVAAPGARSAKRTDLVERNLGNLPLNGGRLRLDLPAHGFAAVRLLL